MAVFSLLPFAAAILSVLLAVANLVRKKPSLATWCFFAGMLVLAVESLFIGFSQRAANVPDILRWLTLALVASSFAPGAWLAFSLAYSRGDSRDSLARWKFPLAAFTVLAPALAVAFRGGLLHAVAVTSAGNIVALRFGPAGTGLNVVLLVAFVLVLTNLEQTFRAAVGTMRWRIKFVVFGLVVIFGSRLYSATQAILFSAQDMTWSAVESSGLLVGGLLLALAYARTGFAEIEVYPSRAVLRSSFTVLIAGGYLFVVGVLAQVARRFGGAENFQLQVLVVLSGMAGLGSLLFSDRLRQRLNRFVGRHFRLAQHDSVRVWSEFSHRLAGVRDQAGLAAAAARLVSGTFEVLSASVWLLDAQKGELAPAASTAREEGAESGPGPALPDSVAAGLCGRNAPFDLESMTEPWAEALRQANPSAFPNGGHRWCVPLRTGERCVGALVLADRVNGLPYTVEELDLLQCIGSQVTSTLLNLQLAGEVARARELEAFRTMSAFFVHDLKNAAASLNLMLRNLPVHFNDPAFRQDALRGVGNSARRIDEMIARLSALRQRPEFHPVDTDLNDVVARALDALGEMPGIAVTKCLQPLPAIVADRDQIQSVVTNLVANARDALCGERAEAGASGSTSGERAENQASRTIDLRTERRGDHVLLSVADNGCGMSPAFLKDSLFRPFQSTKKKGLGIGMFQSRTTVEAHGGSILVESDIGRGTTVCVSLPAKP